VAEYEITVVAACAGDASVNDTASFTARVNPVPHAVTITEGPTGEPDSIASGGDVACSVTVEEIGRAHV